MHRLQALAREMIRYEGGDAARIQHFMKVHGFARLIGLEEGLDVETQLTLEAAALVHDIGIRPAMEKYNSAAGPLQEAEGAPLAEEMLLAVGFDAACAARVAYLVGHHHTYNAIDGVDYQILVEADFLVNLYEGVASREAVDAALANIFRTATGTAICHDMFDLPNSYIR